MSDTPHPGIIFETLNAHQQSAALKGAIDLDLFTAIASGATRVPELAAAVGGTERAVRILADFLVVHEFLTKSGDTYGLTPSAATFLDRRSPAFLGGVARFIHSGEILSAFADVASLVRRGTTALPDRGTVEPDWEGWVEFARSMAPMMMPAAAFIAELATERRPGPIRVLDVAASHGQFGISIARANPEARIVALDWERVLDVALENAREAGVEDRFERLPGDAFTVELGRDHDLVLLTNFLHHFDRAECVQLMKRFAASLGPKGIVLTLEFVPDEGRVSPPIPATFSFMMLGTTPAGDAYTLAEYAAMWKEAGLTRHELVQVPSSPQQLIISQR